jgi:hypothetical protein
VGVHRMPGTAWERREAMVLRHLSLAGQAADARTKYGVDSREYRLAFAKAERVRKLISRMEALA